MPAHLTGTNHVNLTVRDVERSAEWYCRVFGLTVVSNEVNVGPPYFTDDAYRGLFDLRALSYVVGLVQPSHPSPGEFDPARLGLDHVGFQVAEAADLVDWAARLDELGVEHSGIVVAPYAHVISFKDPDGIALELSWADLSFWVGLVERAG